MKYNKFGDLASAIAHSGKGQTYSKPILEIFGRQNKLLHLEKQNNLLVPISMKYATAHEIFFGQSHNLADSYIDLNNLNDLDFVKNALKHTFNIGYHALNWNTLDGKQIAKLLKAQCDPTNQYKFIRVSPEPNFIIGNTQRIYVRNWHAFYDFAFYQDEMLVNVC